MGTFLERIRLRFIGRESTARVSETPRPAPEPAPEPGRLAAVQVEELDMPSNDPLLAYMIQSASAVEIARLQMDSPTLERLRAAGVRVSVPLVSQGELIGLLNLGERLSEQEYSTDDQRLLNNLAAQAAPALRVAQLAYQQQVQARERERMEQELRVARFIQQNLLPRQLPQMPGWQIAAHWQPAREVSGDFYDFIELSDGRMAFLVADVTDKGVPAALVMATTRSLLRSTAERFASPGMVLERTNNLLHPDIPAKMFVTCVYGVLDPQTGEITIANAGHNLPFQHTRDGFIEHRATGMPLGLMPGMTYPEVHFRLEPGDTLLLTSDGLIEAHNPAREMFGFERVKTLVDVHADEDLIQKIMLDFNSFTGPDHEQEDDLTLMTLSYDPRVPAGEKPEAARSEVLSNLTGEAAAPAASLPPDLEPALSFELPSLPGNERVAAQRVLEAVAGLGWSETRLKRLETAVAEAAMNAMEHGNGYNPELPAEITLSREGQRLRIRISDQGSKPFIPQAAEPSLEAKLSGEQSARGWGLFLIRNMVDEMNTFSDQGKNTIELFLNLDD